LGLSRRRAESVVRYLTSVGVEAGRLQSRGYGFDIPRAGSNPADAGNRRVEFAVIQDNQSARAELPGSES
jgi:outer membrane protein OmpA-like peptidoglycan-associated protein